MSSLAQYMDIDPFKHFISHGNQVLSSNETSEGFTLQYKLRQGNLTSEKSIRQFEEVLCQRYQLNHVFWLVNTEGKETSFSILYKHKEKQFCLSINPTWRKDSEIYSGELLEYKGDTWDYVTFPHTLSTKIAQDVRMQILYYFESIPEKRIKCLLDNIKIYV